MPQRFSQRGFYFRFGTRIKIYTYKIYSLSASLAQGKEEKGGVACKLTKGCLFMQGSISLI